jgi:hypothetical protein
MASFNIVKYRNAFPNLTDSNHRNTSEPTKSYNCFGWALSGGEMLIAPLPGYFWPKSAPRNLKLASLAIVADAFGYSRCENGVFEEGIEKIALYGLVDGVDHAARQLQTNGRWTSKRGLEDDIEHDTAECISGGKYGQVLAYFSRPFAPPSGSPPLLP